MSSVPKSDKMGPTLNETDFLKMVTFIRGELSNILATASTEDGIKTYVSNLVRYIEATEDSLNTACSDDNANEDDNPEDTAKKVDDPDAPKSISDAVKIIKQEVEEVLHHEDEEMQEKSLGNGEQMKDTPFEIEDNYGGETDENSDAPEFMYDVKVKIDMDDPLMCKNCVKKFDTEAAFQTHIDSTPGSKRFKCTGCCKTFKQNVSLKLHRVEENHGINEENAVEMKKFVAKLFTCATCDKKFLARSSLDSHVLVHTGQKPHKCRTCGKSFKQRRSLKLHADKEGHIMSKSRHSDKKVKDEIKRGKREEIKQEKKEEIKREKRKKREKLGHREKRGHREKLEHREPREQRETGSESKRSRTESKRSRTESKRSVTESKRSRSRHDSKSESLSPVRNKVYRCKHCDRIYSSQNQLNSHMKVHAKGKEFGCSTCGRCFTRKETLEKHVESNCAADVFPVQVKCSMCEEMFSRRSLLDVHLSKHMKPVEEEVAMQDEIVDNFLQNSESRNFNSEEVNALANQIALGIFKDDVKPSEGNGSVTVSHKPLNVIRPPPQPQKGKRGRPPGTRKPPHQCKFCSKTFKRRREWRNHQYLHTGEKPHVCDICGKTFRLRQVMSLHMNTHGENLFKCTVCDKSYPYKNQLVRHSFTHTGIRPYKCEQCGKGFLSKPELGRHRDTHTPGGVKTFVCDICGKACQNIRKHHLAVHTPREKVPCEICHKEYVSNAKLKVHMLTHTNTKSYICPICGKGFSMNKYLSKHMMLSHGEKKHKCAVCGKAFAFSQQLRMHQRTHAGMSGEGVTELQPPPVIEQQPQTVLNEHDIAAAHFDMQAGLLGIPERSLAVMPERTIATGMPERTIATVIPDHTIATIMPERTIADGMTERTIVTGMPERPIVTGMPERTIVTGMPERTTIVTGMPERTMAGISERTLAGMPERTIAGIQDRAMTELQDRTLIDMSERTMPVTLPMTMPVMPAHSGMPLDRPISGMHPMMHERPPVIDNSFIYPYTSYASTYPSPYL